MVFKAGEGAGRSGSFFFFSHDRKFIIKTMTPGELKLFLKILPALAEHHTKTPRSILAKIFGVFTVKMRGVDAVHIMLMENTLRLKNPDRLNYIFDLKGSKVARKVKGVTKPSTTLKDINFMMAAKENTGFTRQTELNHSVLRSAIRKDVEFLRSQGLMDYSLLLGIETLDHRPMIKEKIHMIGAPRFSMRMQRPIMNDVGMRSAAKSNDLLVPNGISLRDDDEVKDVGELMSLKHCFVTGRRVYHMAIIDYLQEWNFSKKAERFTKTVLMGKDGD